MADFEESTRKMKSKSGKGKGAEKDSAKDSKDVVIQDEEEPVEGPTMQAFILIALVYFTFCRIGSSNVGTTGDMIDVSKPIGKDKFDNLNFICNIFGIH
jgi:hypothetical protein